MARRPSAAEDVRRPLGPGERAVDVAGDVNAEAADRPVQTPRCRSARGRGVPARPARPAHRGVQQTDAERGRHPGAAVGGRAAAQADEQLGRASVRRREDQLAGAARRARSAFRRVSGTSSSPDAWAISTMPSVASGRATSPNMA